MVLFPHTPTHPTLAPAEWAAQCLQMLKLDSGVSLHDLAHHHEASQRGRPQGRPLSMPLLPSSCLTLLPRLRCSVLLTALSLLRLLQRVLPAALPRLLAQIYPGSKRTHFRRIHERTGIPYEEMLVRPGTPGCSGCPSCPPGTC